MFASLLGNASIVASLRRMLAQDRLPQTLLFAGPAGVGKATVARLVAAAMNCTGGGEEPCGACSPCRRILAADLSLPEYRELAEERAKLAPDKRRDSPLIVATHPEFLCFPPDGPLAQISIEQVRRLKEHARFGPSEGRRRLFLLDQADRADAPAANSLLKILEEPPPYLTLILTAENAFELLPTIRSRCVPFFFAPLEAEEMERFLAGRPEIAAADHPKLAAWAQGSPGRALALDIAEYQKRRQAMLALVRAATRQGTIGELIRHTEAMARSKAERLELHLHVLYGLLADLLRLQPGWGSRPLVNEDLRAELEAVAAQAPFPWLDRALRQVDALETLTRRNIQKQIALEGLAAGLRTR